MTTETKTLHFNIKAVGTSTTDAGQEFGHVEAYGAVFGNVDDGNDRILPGAFKRTIQHSEKRAESRQKRYLIPMLWQHKPEELIGGWCDLQEDSYGLLCKGDIALGTQRGREYYELAKAGMTDQLSIIYDVPGGGAKYDKAGVRNLSELRLYSVDPVTFAMNEDTRVVGLKSVCGSTDLPIGPRNESWDGGEAHAQIVKWASTKDGGIDSQKMRQVHLRMTGDPDTISSYSYPFCYIEDGSPRIAVGGVKACASALAGARGADAGDDAEGMQHKINTLYARINDKYPDNPPLGKAGLVHEQKDFNSNYQEMTAQDLLEDWYEVLLPAMSQTMCDIFMSDTDDDDPLTAMQQALAQFEQAVLAWTRSALQANLQEYLQTMPTFDENYEAMSASRRLQKKHGRSISAANAATIDDHVQSVHDLADKAMNAMAAHCKSLHAAADRLAAIGKPATSEDNDDQDEDDQDENTPPAKSTSHGGARSSHSASATAKDEQELEAAFQRLRSLRQSRPSTWS